MQLLHLARQATELAGEPGEQRVAEAAVPVEELEEELAREHPGLAGFERHRGGRARRSVQQCQLAEEVARAQGRDDGLLALGAGEDDLHGSGADEMEGVTGIALVEDDLASAEAAASELAGDVDERGLFGSFEKARRAQAAGDELLVHVPNDGAGGRPASSRPSQAREPAPERAHRWPVEIGMLPTRLSAT